MVGDGGVEVWLLKGDVQIRHADEFAERGEELIDVRAPEQHAEGSIPGSRNIPRDELRGRLHAPSDPGFPKARALMGELLTFKPSSVSTEQLSHLAPREENLGHGRTLEPSPAFPSRSALRRRISAFSKRNRRPAIALL
jgi:hypothetical protein